MDTGMETNMDEMEIAFGISELGDTPKIRITPNKIPTAPTIAEFKRLPACAILAATKPPRRVNPSPHKNEKPMPGTEWYHSVKATPVSSKLNPLNIAIIPVVMTKKRSNAKVPNQSARHPIRMALRLSVFKNLSSSPDEEYICFKILCLPTSRKFVSNFLYQSICGPNRFPLPGKAYHYQFPIL